MQRRKFSSSVAKALALATCISSCQLSTSRCQNIVGQGMAEIEALSAWNTHCRQVRWSAAGSAIFFFFRSKADSAKWNGYPPENISAPWPHISYKAQTFHETPPDSRRQDPFGYITDYKRYKN